jgi:hypothetical protein
VLLVNERVDDVNLPLERADVEPEVKLAAWHYGSLVKLAVEAAGLLRFLARMTTAVVPATRQRCTQSFPAQKFAITLRTRSQLVFTLLERLQNGGGKLVASEGWVT